MDLTTLFMRRMLDAQPCDEEVWRTSEEGHHFKLESETGEIKGGFGGKLNGRKIQPKKSSGEPKLGSTKSTGGNGNAQKSGGSPFTPGKTASYSEMKKAYPKLDDKAIGNIRYKKEMLKDSYYNDTEKCIGLDMAEQVVKGNIDRKQLRDILGYVYDGSGKTTDLDKAADSLIGFTNDVKKRADEIMNQHRYEWKGEQREDAILYNAKHFHPGASKELLAFYIACEDSEDYTISHYFH